MTAEDVETNEKLKKAELENGFYNIIDGVDLIKPASIAR